jgi:hypothetical protein
MRIQKLINKIDALIALRPAILQQYKNAKSAGEDVTPWINKLKEIQDAESKKPGLILTLESAIGRLNRKMEFGGFSTSTIEHE